MSARRSQKWTRTMRKRLAADFGPYCRAERCKRKGTTLDHIVPLSKGGTNYYENLQLMCVICHRKKDNERPRRFIGDAPIARVRPKPASAPPGWQYVQVGVCWQLEEAR